MVRTAPVLRVGAALPDPPFEFMTKDGPAGFDIALIKRIAEILGRKWQLVPYEGADFNGIFGGLDDGSYDCIASGTTITPGRRKIAAFCAPYAVSGQSLVVDVGRHPNVHGIADLKGLVIGVQQGNTSQPVADRLVAGHRAARVLVYAYDEIEKALDDLTSGGCDAFMKLRSTACRDFPQDDLGHLKIVAFSSLGEASADAFAIFCSAVLAHFPLALEPRDGEATTDDAAQHGFDEGIGRI